MGFGCGDGMGFWFQVGETTGVRVSGAAGLQRGVAGDVRATVFLVCANCGLFVFVSC